MMISHTTLARRLAELFQAFPQVEAVALTGSRVAGLASDVNSDIDLVVFTTSLVPLKARQAVIEGLGGAARANLNHEFWGLCDEWTHAPSSMGVDIVYWDTRWVEGLLERVINQHQPSLGYSTAHWFTIRSAQLLFDRSGWLERTQEWSRVPYPEALRQAIIRDNLAVLRPMISSYRSQVAKAVGRGDLISVNHRVAGLIASYFDVIFAGNRVLHPGEKRLLEHASRLCSSLPENMAEDVSAVLRASGEASEIVLENIDRLVERLEGWIKVCP